MAPAQLRLSLIAAALLGASGCGTPTWSFSQVDLRAGEPPPPSKILVGKRAVVRLRSDGSRGRWGTWIQLDLFPPEARLRGAWVKMRFANTLTEGPLEIQPPADGRGYTLHVPRGHGGLSPATPSPGPDGVTAWLGPVCVGETCETFRVDEADWPRRPGPGR
jgi:hypothetical protein